MNKILTLCSLTILATAVSFAAGFDASVRIDATKVPANDGKQMYATYCATCHGVDGRGNGPMASRLAVHPANLTTLAAKNHGKFPDAHVFTVVSNGSGPATANNSTYMPSWGKVFHRMEISSPQDTFLREANLARYLNSLQTK